MKLLWELTNGINYFQRYT